MAGFLEARRILAAFQGGAPLEFLLAMSGTSDQLDLYLRARAAERGRDARVGTLPFNTLGQLLLQPAEELEEVFLLLPWDLLPQADWRSGIPRSPQEFEMLRQSAAEVAGRLAQRKRARFLYLPAALPPLLPHPGQNRALAFELRSLAASLGAVELPAGSFSLATYLNSGCPVGGGALWEVAGHIISAALDPAPEPCKVLVTDLDNTLWSGVIAEDGEEGIYWRAEGKGYRHFIYQTLLARLRIEGVLLAAVSRNDPEVALAPLRKGEMPLREGDFVAVIASYHAKSAQIRELATQLNLGLDSFVFVDDNPVELAEVSLQVPGVHCVTFPGRAEELPALLEQVEALFPRRRVTAEDRERTEMYRRRLAGMVPSELAGADLSGFLRDLQMRLTLHDRSAGDRTRAVQLINKTNQFNLNGVRVEDDEVQAVLDAGGRLYSASLEDRHGSHGEILSCLIRPDGTIASLVMSCRVFQRRVEYAFLAWLCARDQAPNRLEHAATERNSPLREFLRDAAFSPLEGGLVALDARRFARDHEEDLALFDVAEPAAAGEGA